MPVAFHIWHVTPLWGPPDVLLATAPHAHQAHQQPDNDNVRHTSSLTMMMTGTCLPCPLQKFPMSRQGYWDPQGPPRVRLTLTPATPPLPEQAIQHHHWACSPGAEGGGIHVIDQPRASVVVT